MNSTAVCAANPAAQRHCEPTLHELFFQVAQVQGPIRASILFTSDRFPLLVLVNLIEQQIRICVAIGCRLPDGSVFYCWITGSRRPLDGQFE